MLGSWNKEYFKINFIEGEVLNLFIIIIFLFRN